MYSVVTSDIFMIIVSSIDTQDNKSEAFDQLAASQQSAGKTFTCITIVK